VSRWLVLAAAVVAVDQGSKWLVVRALLEGERIALLPVLSLVRWHNEGAAWSMLSDAGGWQRWLFVVLALLFSAFVLYELRRLAPGQWLMGVVYGLLLGGALGNLVDRLLYGYVVDFVLVHYRSWFFPAFNVADAALTVGAALWIGLLLLGRDRPAEPAEAQRRD